MDIILMIPKVVRSYLSRFPEVQRNAYPYFNYDNRVVDESVDRGTQNAWAKPAYRGPDCFNDGDYDLLVKYAMSLLNPVLIKYSPRVACEDALSLAIRSYGNGLFDGKVNANKYNVLLQSMMSPQMMTAARKKEKEDKEVAVKPNVLRWLGVKRKELPKKERVRERMQKGPHLYKSKGKIMLKKKS